MVPLSIGGVPFSRREKACAVPKHKKNYCFYVDFCGCVGKASLDSYLDELMVRGQDYFSRDEVALALGVKPPALPFDPAIRSLKGLTTRDGERNVRWILLVNEVVELAGRSLFLPASRAMIRRADMSVKPFDCLPNRRLKLALVWVEMSAVQGDEPFWLQCLLVRGKCKVSRRNGVPHCNYHQ